MGLVGSSNIAKDYQGKPMRDGLRRRSRANEVSKPEPDQKRWRAEGREIGDSRFSVATGYSSWAGHCPPSSSRLASQAIPLVATDFIGSNR